MIEYVLNTITISGMVVKYNTIRLKYGLKFNIIVLGQSYGAVHLDATKFVQTPN